MSKKKAANRSDVKSSRSLKTIPPTEESTSIPAKRIQKREEKMPLVAELQQLDKKRTELVNELEELDQKVIDLKKKRAEELLTEIKALGLEVPFPWGKKEKAEKKPVKPAGEKSCKICEIKGHDTRAHNRHPEKFTEDELAAKGWPTT